MTEPRRRSGNSRQVPRAAQAALDAQADAINEEALAPMSLYRSLAQVSLHF
jgi:hypothetical protein